MTILDFYAEGCIVLCVDMSKTNFIYKVCEKISDGELLKFHIIDERTMAMVYTDKAVIKKMWYGCFKHGFINQPYDTWVDKLVKRTSNY